MIENLKIANADILLEGQSKSADLLLFLPGMSGKARSDRFQGLVELAKKNKTTIARVDIWNEEKPINEYTINQIREILEKIVEEFVGRGYGRICFVGKSFGGAMGLILEHSSITKKILWAPAITFGGEVETLSIIGDKRIGTVATFDEIKVSSKMLKENNSFVGIIHGTEDVVIPTSNSKAIANAVPHGTLSIVEEANHSFQGKDKELLEKTGELMEISV